jgi:hypothetical protein
MFVKGENACGGEAKPLHGGLKEVGDTPFVSIGRYLAVYGNQIRDEMVQLVAPKVQVR